MVIPPPPPPPLPPIPPPPPLIDPFDLPAFTRLPRGYSHSTVLPDMDFETYSEAGYVFEEKLNKWVSIIDPPPIYSETKKRWIPSAKPADGGLPIVGAAVYSEHPSTEVLCLSYNLKDGRGPRLWFPYKGLPLPYDLFEYLRKGGEIEAHNSSFEYYIWNNVCVPKYGFPPLYFIQLRDSKAKARAFSVPGALADAATVLKTSEQKDAEGKRLIKKFCEPHTPTKKIPARRIRPEDDWPDFVNLLKYNLQDIRAESAVSAALPDLSESELSLWLEDQQVNFRGVHIDLVGVTDCIAIVNDAFKRYNAELCRVTGGQVESASKIKALVKWMRSRGVHTENLDDDAVEALKACTDLPADVMRVVEIRSIIGSASVKKLFAICRRVSKDGRLRDLFEFCGADRTGRFAGRGPQPQNLPSSGPAVINCEVCGGYYGEKCGDRLIACPHCKSLINQKKVEWNIKALEYALQVISSRNLDYVEQIFGDAIEVVSACLRGLFMAAPGKEFMCSDYSAIEAVVLACLAGEQWRIDVFKSHGKIYEMSASKISGVPFEEFMRHKGYTDITSPRWWEAKTKGEHHPLRKKLGKVAELASGYQGGYGAWCNFGADKHLSEQEIRDAIQAWRKASPAIVNFWYGLERAAISAIQNPGLCYDYRGITYFVKDNILYCRLLSGRTLTYHEPILTPGVTPWGKNVLKISYMGWDKILKKWVRQETYGGKLCENVVQATARDILTHAIMNLEKAGYPIVLHVHDEIIAEIIERFGSVEEFEKIMSTLPDWCKDWPIRAAGGWRGKRYRKE